MRFHIYLILLVISTVAFAHVEYPIKTETAGLTKYISVLKENHISTPDDLRTFMHANPNGNTDPKTGEVRYLYSSKWGWLDLKHMAAAIEATSRWYLTGHAVLKLGELEELKQSLENEDSAYDYEDLVSNMIGVFFESEFVDIEKIKNKDLVSQLQIYLTLLGFSDTPLKDAPNEIPDNYTLPKDKIPHNYDYHPKYVTKSEKDFNSIDNALAEYRAFYESGL